jgi:hypothetical protein
MRKQNKLFVDYASKIWDEGGPAWNMSRPRYVLTEEGRVINASN